MIPLPLELWFERIALIADGSVLDIENRLRHASHLLQLSPRPLRRCLNWQIDEQLVERLLEAERFGEAARYLIGRGNMLRVAEASANDYHATVECGRSLRRAAARGQCEASAILAAGVGTLLEIRDAVYEQNDQTTQGSTSH